MRIKSYREALQLALCAGEDAANRRMRKAGRKAWSDADFTHASNEAERFLVNLGFDIPGWIATAGFPRNEPEQPKSVRKSRSRVIKPPVQLCFAFAC